MGINGNRKGLSMKNPVIFYAVIALGVIALAVGVFFLTYGGHPFRSYSALGVGAVLLIAGVIGTFVICPKAVTK